MASHADIWRVWCSKLIKVYQLFRFTAKGSSTFYSRGIPSDASDIKRHLPRISAQSINSTIFYGRVSYASLVDTSCNWSQVNQWNLLFASFIHSFFLSWSFQLPQKNRRFWFFERFGRFIFFRFLACFCGRLQVFAGVLRVFAVVFLSFLICGRLRPKLGKHQNYQKFLVVGSSRFFLSSFLSWIIRSNGNAVRCCKSVLPIHVRTQNCFSCFSIVQNVCDNRSHLHFYITDLANLAPKQRGGHKLNVLWSSNPPSLKLELQHPTTVRKILYNNFCSCSQVAVFCNLWLEEAIEVQNVAKHAGGPKGWRFWCVVCFL